MSSNLEPFIVQVARNQEKYDSDNLKKSRIRELTKECFFVSTYLSDILRDALISTDNVNKDRLVVKVDENLMAITCDGLYFINSIGSVHGICLCKVCGAHLYLDDRRGASVMSVEIKNSRDLIHLYQEQLRKEQYGNDICPNCKKNLREQSDSEEQKELNRIELEHLLFPNSDKYQDEEKHFYFFGWRIW